MPLRVYRHNRTRAAAAVMAAVLVALLAFSAAAVAAEARHDCSGADCAVCALVRTAVARFAIGGAAVLAAAGLFLLPRAGRLRRPAWRGRRSPFLPSMIKCV